MDMILVMKTYSGISKIEKPNMGMGATLGAPVHKGLKARTEASRVAPMPHAAKPQFNLLK
ncbi:MAG: hypothetical protein P9L94_14190 [Candidatus Hinthialibacter antarcticus]|nr:hypothetical protein [Candidatus Hinthialibacter antarcticus]